MTVAAKADRGPTALKQVRTIVLRALAGYPTAVYLFGSWATGTQRGTSDIDIAIDAAEPLPVGLLARLREALEESTVPQRVDVIDLADTSGEFRRRVRRKGIRWTDSENL